MSAKAITNRSVAALKCLPSSDRAFLWDDAIAGYGVAAFPSGKKVYVFQYRHAGRSRRITLGTHGSITPEQARALAKINAGLVAKGEDPLQARRAEHGVRTVRELAEDYLRLHVEKKLKSRTSEEYARLLKLHILPALGSKRLSDVKRADVTRLHNSMSNSPAAANRALTLIATLWNWGKDQEEFGIGENPASRIEKYPEKSRERFLTSEEVARLEGAIRLAETDGIPWKIDSANPNAKHVANKKETRTRIDPYAAGAIRLLILTGARLREILNARWDYVDWERGILFLPDSKSGRKPIYLSAPALAVLKNLPRVHDNPYIIAGHGSRKSKGVNNAKSRERKTARVDLKNPWAAVVRAAGFIELTPDTDKQGNPIIGKGGQPAMQERATVRIHDLRHSFASVGAGASLGLPIIGKLLGHRQAATTARYSHLDADPLRRAADIIGNQIAAAMDGRKAEVVNIVSARKRS